MVKNDVFAVWCYWKRDSQYTMVLLLIENRVFKCIIIICCMFMTSK